MSNTLVQSQSSFANLGGASTAALAFTTQNTAAGNLLVAIIQDFTQAATLTSVTDNQGGNTWVVLPVLLVSTVYNLYLAYALNTTGGTKPTVTANFSGITSNVAMALAEFNGPNTFRSQDAGNTGIGSPISSASLTATAGDLLIGYYGDTTGEEVANLSATTPFTLGPTGGLTATAFICAMEYNLTASAGSASAAFTQTGSVPAWACGLAAFFQQQVATSTFSPVAGTYTGTQSVTVSNSNSALTGFAQYYTTDGSTPTTGSTLYTGAIPVNSSLTIKVLAVATGYANSAIASAAYTITIASRSTRSK